MILIYLFQIWFLPLGIHAITRTIINQPSLQKIAKKSINQTKDDVVLQCITITAGINSRMKEIQPNLDMRLRRMAPTLPICILHFFKNSCFEHEKPMSIYIDVSIQLIKLSIFLM